MLTYTFTSREKALILVFAVVLVLIAWYWFVFQGTTNQITAIDGDIANVQSQIEIDQARATQLGNMKKVVEQREAEGAKKTVMPTYDNLQPLMAQLNGTMGAADTFTLTFDQLNRDNADYITRGVRIDYTCGSYKDAEAIVSALSAGNYPCSVDSVAINDPTVLKSNKKTTSGLGWSSTSSNQTVSASVHVTFFERYPEGYVRPDENATS